MNHRLQIFEEIHDICFHGKGGFTLNLIYEMPIWWRKFTYKRIQKYYEEENKRNNKQEDLDLTNPTKIHKPDIPKPTYKTKGH